MSALRRAQSRCRRQATAALQTECRSAESAAYASLAGHGCCRAVCCYCAAGAVVFGVGASLLAFGHNVLSVAGVALAIVDVHGCVGVMTFCCEMVRMFDFSK